MHHRQNERSEESYQQQQNAAQERLSDRWCRVAIADYVYKPTLETELLTLVKTTLVRLGIDGLPRAQRASNRRRSRQPRERHVAAR